MATILDYGSGTDPLSSPSLAEWAEAVATDLGGRGGLIQVALSVPSSTSGSSELVYTATPLAAQLWGGVTRSGNALVVATTGLYRVTVHGAFATDGGGTIRGLWVWSTAGGGTVDSQAGLGAAAAALDNTTGIGGSLSASGVWRIPAGIGVRAMARQDSGAALTMTAALSLTLIRATS